MFPRRVKIWHVFVAFAVSLSLVILSYRQVSAESCDNYDQGSQAYYDCLGRSIDDLNSQLQQSINATKPLQGQSESLKKQLDSLQAKISAAEKQMQDLSASITSRERTIATQYAILSIKVRDYYKKMSMYSPILMFLSSRTANDLTRNLAYKAISVNDDKNLIVNITNDIMKLEDDKKKVEASKAQLAALQTKLDSQKKFFDTQIASAQAWQSQLNSKIAALSAKQQSFLAAKLGSLNLPTSLGAGPLYCTDDRNIDPGFSNAFAFFTYGIPHRVGMDQYGAYGRAKAGQSYETILRAYFDNISIDSHDNTTITVDGYGSMPIETYLLGVYEIPGDWPIEALKAQAVAARSYALAYTHNGANSICTTQACQVYKGGNKGGAWEQAVRDTAGKVLTSGGQVITAWYASTSGGYLFNNSDVWGGAQKPWTKRLRDTSGDVNGFGDLKDKAYDKDSPCFYAAQGFRKEYSKSAWLKSSEVADIVNVLMLAKKDSGTQTHLSQPDKPNPDGAETWDAGRVQSELRSRGGSPYSSISGVSVAADFGTGKVTSVTVSGDAGSQTFNANEFIDYFNLRAPANIQIVGPLFNVERR